MPSMLSPLGRYHRATRSWPAAVLLQQVAYWWPRAKITLADEVRAGIARLLGRQFAREWLHAQEAGHEA